MASTQFYSPLTGIRVAAAVRGALARSGARITVCRLLPLVSSASISNLKPGRGLRDEEPSVSEMH